MTTLSLTLAGCSLAGFTEWDLIRELRDERGIIAGEWTAGQVALAKWMLGGDMAQDIGIRFSRLLVCLSEDQTVRILTGEAEPEPTLADMIAETTEGAVRPGMFARAVMPPMASLRETTVLPPALTGGAGTHPVSPRHVQLDDDFDLLNTPDGLTIVGRGRSVTIPLGAAAKLRGGLGQMLAM